MPAKVDKLIAGVSEADVARIDAILERLEKIHAAYNRPPSTTAIQQANARALLLCHAVIPLKLDAMLIGPEYDFLHDIVGIQRHLDMKTGRMGGCFLPRYARLED